MGNQTGKQIADAMVNYYLVNSYDYRNRRMTEGELNVKPSALSSISQHNLATLTFRAKRNAVTLTTGNLYRYFGHTFPIVTAMIQTFVQDVLNELDHWKIVVNEPPKTAHDGRNTGELILSSTIDNKADMRRSIIEFREFSTCVHANIIATQRIGNLRPLRDLIDISLMVNEPWSDINSIEVLDGVMDRNAAAIGKDMATGVFQEANGSVAKQSPLLIGATAHTIIIPKDNLLLLYAQALFNDEGVARIRAVLSNTSDDDQSWTYHMNIRQLSANQGRWHGE